MDVNDVNVSGTDVGLPRIHEALNDSRSDEGHGIHEGTIPTDSALSPVHNHDNLHRDHNDEADPEMNDMKESAKMNSPMDSTKISDHDGDSGDAIHAEEVDSVATAENHPENSHGDVSAPATPLSDQEKACT